jgi:hypothetical protein
MGQQFGDFRDVRIFPGLVEKIEELLQRIRIIANVPDNRVQVLENLVGVFRQESLGMLIVNLQSILVLASLHQGIGEGRNRRQVVVHGQQLVGYASRLR